MSSDIGGVGMSGVSGVKAGADAATSAKKIDKQLFGAAVVKATLDTMNADPNRASGLNPDYDFQTKVLEAGAMAKGLAVGKKV